MKLSYRFLLIVAAVICMPLSTRGQDASPDYTQHVAPILEKYCTGCHNAADREGDLSLESYEDLQRGGATGAAMLPGEAASSRLIRLITGEAEPKMPPEDNEAPTAEEIAVLRKWIDSGAPGPDGAQPDRRLLRTPQLPPAADAPQQITALAVSPDGLQRALGGFTHVRLQPTSAAEEGPRLLNQLPGKVNSVSFSRDSQLLVVGSGVAGLYGEASLYKVADMSLLRQFVGHRDTLYDAVLSHDQKLLATCSYDRTIILWNAETGEQLRTLDGHNGAIYDLEFSPDGQVLASASADETVKLWRVSDGQRLDTLSQPEGEQYTVRFSPDGQFVVAGGGDNRIRVWKFISHDSPRINPIVFARFAHEGPITSLAFSADGSMLASAAEDRTLKLWETAGYSELHLYEPLQAVSTGLAFGGNDSQLLVSQLDGQLLALPVVTEPASASASATTSAPSSATVEPMPPMPAPQETAEAEPNNDPASAQLVALPIKVNGVIEPGTGASEDVDLYRFASQAGQQWVIEIDAARQQSPLDSRVEVLDEEGRPIQRVLLQAVRDSYFTFRGKDSETIDDFRLHNWEEMELNEYLYANGEVVKLWLYPRGPDSGFKVYPGVGKRYGFFDTTPIAHALGETCYIVVPHPPGTALIPNGLPVFPVYYENDDDSLRRWGRDSRLTFTAPSDGNYLVRVTDVRGFGSSDHRYALTIRPRQPDFQVTLGGMDPTVNAGSGKEFSVTAERLDGFDDDIRVDIEGVPPGFDVTSPVIIQAGQNSAVGVIYAAADAPQPTPESAAATKVTATATIHGQTVVKQVGSLGTIKLAEKPKLLARIVPEDDSTSASQGVEQAANAESSSDNAATPWELVIAPGTTVTAKVQIERNGFDGAVLFGNEDSGRNLPHGVFIDNIGLNGLLIVEGQQERTFFVTAAPWAPEMTRLFHLKARVEDQQCTLPVLLRIQRTPSSNGGQ